MTIGWLALIGGALCLMVAGAAVGLLLYMLWFAKGFHW